MEREKKGRRAGDLVVGRQSKLEHRIRRRAHAETRAAQAQRANPAGKRDEE